MYEQRPVAPGLDRPATRAWTPAVLGTVSVDTRVTRSGGDGGPGPGWWYVVVDECGDERCQVTVDPWPGTDEQGRLRFDPDVGTVDVTIDRGLLAALAALARRRQSAPAPDRPIRVGDVFAVHDDLVRWLLDDPVEASAWMTDPTRPPSAAWADDPGFAWFARAAGHSDGRTMRSDARDLAGLLADVTANARTLAHAAADEAATGVLDAGDLDQLGLRVRVDGQRLDDADGPAGGGAA
ncbi:hypothetical protein [Salsipaludibacter albus]|uniref:hypothetical protein n=1 Tax=Salsipaludibacter albus TaxID=2849650 RepID=UPI001EE48C2E|nr:hypothetical protein [Salsipaludibacter albus]MBY5160870.1 hypothetical protein [Salsipaludibacter albus]